MYPFIVLIVLALSFVVVHRILGDLIPFEVPSVLTRTVAAAAAIGVAWLLDYSVLVAFGQDLRMAWMHPVVTGLTLVAVGESVNAFIDGFSRRVGERSTGTPRTSPRIAA